MTYYKYRTDSEFTEQIFISGKVYLSTAQGLNDPFECSLQEIGKEWIEKQVSTMKQAAVMGFVVEARRAVKNNSKDFWGLSCAEIEQALESIRILPDIDEKHRFYVQFMTKHNGHRTSDPDRLFSQLDAQLLSVGIFSLSANPTQQLMWAHYAKEHSGICIGFSAESGSKLADSEHFLPVIYSNQLPELTDNGFQTQMTFSMDESGRLYTSSLKIPFSDKTFQKAITTKPTTWGYEEEWRYVEPYGGLFEWPGNISEVTFGLRCKEERINHYIQLIEENVPYPVKLFRVRKRRFTNELERIPYDKTISVPQFVSKNMVNENLETQLLTSNDFAAKMERLIQQEKYGEVLFQVDENLKNDPNSPVLLHLKGVAHGFALQHNKALECFVRLSELCPEIANSWYQKACALIELARHHEALEALIKAYSIDPNDASITFNLAIELLKTDHDPQEAIVYLKRADLLGHRRANNIISEIEKGTDT